MVRTLSRTPEQLAGTTDVLVLCGGLGTRFREVRQDIPKCLAPIQGRPFLDLLLTSFIKQGFSNFILTTGYLGNQVRNYVNSRDDGSYRFTEEKELLGTGGALKLAEELVKSNPFLVVNGDSLVDYEFVKLIEDHKKTESDVSILVSSSTKGEAYGSVQMDSDRRIVSFVEKTKPEQSSFTNTGIYCLSPTVLSSLDSGVPISLEKECFPLWIDRFKVTGVRTTSQVHDIGTVERYETAQLIRFGASSESS